MTNTTHRAVRPNSFFTHFGLLTILHLVCKLTPEKVKGRFTLVIQKKIL